MIRITILIKQVNSTQYAFILGSAQPIDEPITFLPISLHQVITPYEDVLVLTLTISEFNVCKILIDPSSFVDILQMLAYKLMVILLLFKKS